MFRFLKNFGKRFLGSLCRVGVTNHGISHSTSRFLPTRVPHHDGLLPRGLHSTRFLASKDELASRGLSSFKFNNLIHFRKIEDFHFHCKSLPVGKNVLCLDVGDYIGCALFDPKKDNKGERMVDTFRRSYFPEKLLEIIEENNVGGIIVGMTLDEEDWDEMKNSKGRRFLHITSFVCEMEKDDRFHGLYFTFSSEFGSTVRAEKITAYRRVKRDYRSYQLGTDIKKKTHLLNRLSAWIILRDCRKNDPDYKHTELRLNTDPL